MSTEPQEERPNAQVASELGTAGAATAGAGASLLALAASACCAAPVVASATVALLGASGAAWAAGFEPYARWLLALAAVALGAGFLAQSRAARACPSARGAKLRLRAVRAVLGISAAIWALALLGHLVWSP
ncbi:MAG: hypothetical protein NDJ75_08870 [Thermoanaerobaculia bacterium]|nr:hypothetical protein [Thermoanaerobaculia bacterium]